MKDSGGAFEVERIPNARQYVIRTQAGIPAVKVELNGDLFPAAWHPAMLRQLERRWVHRVAPPLQLVANGPGQRPLIQLPEGDPYGLLLAPEGEGP